MHDFKTTIIVMKLEFVSIELHYFGETHEILRISRLYHGMYSSSTYY